MLSDVSKKTGYPITQKHGQRLTGPPPDWTLGEPERGSELYCYMIPRDCFEVRHSNTWRSEGDLLLSSGRAGAALPVSRPSLPDPDDGGVQWSQPWLLLRQVFLPGRGRRSPGEAEQPPAEAGGMAGLQQERRQQEDLGQDCPPSQAEPHRPADPPGDAESRQRSCGVEENRHPLA